MNNDDKVIEFLKGTAPATTKQIEQHLGCHPSTARRIVNRLVKGDKIKQVGDGQNRTFYVQPLPVVQTKQQAVPRVEIAKPEFPEGGPTITGEDMEKFVDRHHPEIHRNRLPRKVRITNPNTPQFPSHRLQGLAASAKAQAQNDAQGPPEVPVPARQTGKGRGAW